MSTSITKRIAEALGVAPSQVQAAVDLLDDGATVPFVARYRKEATGGLDDSQLRQLGADLVSLRNLEARRETVLETIEGQGKLTPQLKQKIMGAGTKTELEDLYLPYRPKRRTKAQIAREAGLAPLAIRLLKEPSHDPEREARAFIAPDKGVTDTASALAGAQAILIEQLAEDARLLGRIRRYLHRHAIVTSRVIKKKEEQAAKFRDYFSFDEPLCRLPSHRLLALFRGQKEGFLRLSMASDRFHLENPRQPSRCESMVVEFIGLRGRKGPAVPWLVESAHHAWIDKIQSHMKTALFQHYRELAEEEAVKVFARNLTDLLMAPPAGQEVTLGLDPGIRTGVKTAVVDGTGKVLTSLVIYPHPPAREWSQSLETLGRLCDEYGIKLIAIGNGTGSRETTTLVAELLEKRPEWGIRSMVVSEAGASVYSASELAATELPDLDVTLRGAVSIARRLQDPLSELIKIDPRSIGVGQYQHDLNQTALATALDGVVEDCVNRVGVDLNTSSTALLTHVSGLNKTVAANIVAYRNTHGRFTNRKALMKVPRLGAKAFELAAGFLRIRDGAHPLDCSAVHPESYPLAERIARSKKVTLPALIGNTPLLESIRPEDYVDAQFGLPTIRDILTELEKPGRDPRGDFASAQFKTGVNTIADLQPGMVLEGVVTNITHFGAFVDVGVHQDGLVHISQLADRFVRDPHEVVRVGEVVRVRVMEVDTGRKRISLSRRQSD